MRLTTLGFGLFFAGLLFLYYRVPGKHQWRVLLGANVLFYLPAGREAVCFLLATVCSTYVCTRQMERNREAMEKKQAKAQNRVVLTACLVLNFGMLGLCKACLVEPLTGVLREGRLSFLTLGLPMGISFYLFQTMGYAIDVYRGTAQAEKDPLRLALFASFFPQLVQGPIGRYADLAPQLTRPQPFDPEALRQGTDRMLWGYFKKLVIADRLAPAVAALGDAYGFGFFLLTVLYAVQLYADFTGGIDVVLGMARCLGIALPENFRKPFLSRSIAEYWRRWHITLGAWMKEYIFYPICLSTPIRRLSRKNRKLPVYIATIATWLATGLWHGFTPNFPLWGLLNCAVILLSGELDPVYKNFHRRFGLCEKGWYPGFQVLRTFLLMNLIRACDLYPDPADYFLRLGSLLTPWRWPVPDLGLSGLDLGILAVGLGLLCFPERLKKASPAVRPALLLAVVLMGRYGVGYDAASFVYNQF